MSPDDTRLLTLARSLAQVAHDSQVRKGSGAPYFTHVERVAHRAGSVAGVRGAIVGYLHDVIEDTPVDWRTLSQLFPHEIVQDVRALTRNPDLSLGYPLHPLPGNKWDDGVIGETYREFIARTIATGSDTALQVKVADLTDNLSDLWLAKQEGLAHRYLTALADIGAELERRGVITRPEWVASQ